MCAGVWSITWNDTASSEEVPMVTKSQKSTVVANNAPPADLTVVEAIYGLL